MKARLTPPVSARDHAQGPADAPVTLVEYGDYECPHCGRAYPIVKAVQRSLGNELRFVFRNFPLTRSHEHAEHAAEMAEAAGHVGKFWEMHDLLFENQNALEDEDLNGTPTFFINGMRYDGLLHPTSLLESLVSAGTEA